MERSDHPLAAERAATTNFARYAYTGMNAHWFSATAPESVSGSSAG